MSDEQTPLSDEEIEQWRADQSAAAQPSRWNLRILATIAALREEVTTLTADLEHLRSQAGPDSCADYVMRNSALAEEIAAWKARALDGRRVHVVTGPYIVGAFVCPGDGCSWCASNINPLDVRPMSEAPNLAATESDEQPVTPDVAEHLASLKEIERRREK